MRRSGWGWLAAALLVLCIAESAGAEAVEYGGVVYAYPKLGEQSPALTLTIAGWALDDASFAPTPIALPPGAVFGLYLRENGEYRPLPDPGNPARPWQLTPGADGALAAALPTGIDVYIKQETAPAGFSMPAEAQAYRRVQPGEALVYANYAGDLQGLRILLTDDAGAPLSGVAFLLEGADSFTLTTDAQGLAQVLGLPIGDFSLSQQSTPEGHDAPADTIPVVISPNTPVSLALTNNRRAQLSLDVQGVERTRGGRAQHAALARTYAVYDSLGIFYGALRAGETLSLPATPEGTAYTLSAQDTPQDGYAADDAAHAVLLYSGASLTQQIEVPSLSGYFALTHLDGAGNAINGSEFVLLDASGAVVLSDAAARGRYENPVPLPAGAYTLHLKRVPEGYIYRETAVPLTIQPYTGDETSIAQVALQSDALPALQVTYTAQNLPSLFEADAIIACEPALTGWDAAMTQREVVFSFIYPKVDGLTVAAESAAGASLHLARRYALPGVAELSSLALSGAVRYAYTYPVAEGEFMAAQGEMPFEITAAAFAPHAPTTYALWGYVTDKAGDPVPMVRVWLGDQSATTDTYGAYAFEVQPDGAAVSVEAPAGYAVRMEGANATLLPLLTVSGQVLAYGGADPGAARIAYGAWGETAPDETGRFALSGIDRAGGELTVSAPEGVLTRIERDSDAYTVHLYAQAAISGAVQTPQGMPIPDVAGKLTGEGIARDVTTDSYGQYSLDGLFPGSYTLALTPPEGWIAENTDPLAIDLAAGAAYGAPPLRMMPPARVEGIIAEGSMGLRGVQISVGEATATTDRDGFFLLDGLFAGQYPLVITPPEGVRVLSAPETVEIGTEGGTVSVAAEAVRLAGLSGRIFRDADDNGLFTIDESGQVGALVSLLDEAGQVLTMQETGAAGTFIFNELLPGVYRVSVSLPDGMLFAKAPPAQARMLAGGDSAQGVSEALTLSAGEQREGLLAGAVATGAAVGQLTDDAGAPLSGVPITLLRGAEHIAQTLSDAQGRFTFEPLRPGDYAVSVQLPAGILLAPQSRTAFSVRGGQTDIALDTVRAAAMTVSIFTDVNGDGQNLREAGMAGVHVELLGARGEVAASAVTDAEGRAQFDSLYPGTYNLRCTLPGADWGFTTGAIEAFVLTAGQMTSAEVGMAQMGRVAGMVFADADYDGLRGAAEGAVSAEVTLLNENGDALTTSSTDAAGHYAFEALPPGQYAVRITLPGGYAFTRTRADAPSYNSDVAEGAGPSAQTAAFFLPMGVAMPVDAGAYAVSSARGMLFRDQAGDGRIRAGNEPLAGHVVRLLRENSPYAEAITDAAGNYTFEALPPGEYAIEVTIEPGERFSLSPAGNVRGSRMPATDALTGQMPLILPMGMRADGLDIGIVRTASLAGSAGAPGATLTLWQGETRIAETLSGADGRYALADLRPGEAILRITPPAGWVLTAGQAADQKITLRQGEATLPMDWSVVPEAIIEGLLWLDADGDGQLGAEEATLPGIPLLLTSLDAQHRITQTTDAQGRFVFRGLNAGDYALAPENGALGEALLYEADRWAALRITAGDAALCPMPAYAPGALAGRITEGGNAAKPLPGAHVELLSAERRVLAEQTTGEDGAYRFDALPPGDYALRATLPTGYLFEAAAFPLAEGTVSQIAPFALPMGVVISNLDGRAVLGARVGDLLWLDENGNGLQETAEPGIAGVTVTLLRIAQDGGETAILQTQTDARGRYRFDSVRPGRYRVAFALEEGVVSTESMAEPDEINSKILPGDAQGRTEIFEVKSGDRVLWVDGGVQKEP
ncbi:MAG: carboxypeptidase regulatory-like domain-containing protein [Oscillospiraceae bacterium]|jgi:protocatechuate 3,4-dioxygenase beta subunit|nr:carboxypeptidase regulatory-like domain-containing protein [Oscillospiraceae bacterium]